MKPRVRLRDDVPAARAKAHCRHYSGLLVKRGVLIPQPCEDCGTTVQVQKHHDDYTQPRLVRWKCAPCHRRFHRPPPVCSGCRGPRDRGEGQRYCRACRNMHARAMRRRLRGASS